MISFTIVVVLSCLISLIVIALAQRLQLGMDATKTHQPQKFHEVATPRLGGIGIFGALLICAYGFNLEEPLRNLLVGLLLASLPAYLGGLGEDVSGRFTPLMRLVLTFLAAAIAWFLLDAQLTRVGVYGFDDALANVALISICFTMFAVGGVAHSINIIDGYNGLMGLVSVLALMTFAGIAWQLGEMIIMQLAILFMASIVGFLLLNFPLGKIFMGDGGAYLVGFLIAEIAVLMVAAQSQISPWSGFLIMAYPITETLFSMYRKKVLRAMSPGQPDGLHLHMLVYKKVFLRKARRTGRSKRWCHAMTSLSLMVFAAIPMLMALFSYDASWKSLLCLSIFVCGYLFCYFRLLGRGLVPLIPL